MKLFVYGTLKCREQIEFLLKRRLGHPVRASMPQMTTVISDWGYFVMVPAEDSSVEGIVWSELTDHDFHILDQYEGCERDSPVYRRETRYAIIDGHEEEVWVYCGTSAFLTQIRDP